MRVNGIGTNNQAIAIVLTPDARNVRIYNSGPSTFWIGSSSDIQPGQGRPCRPGEEVSWPGGLTWAAAYSQPLLGSADINGDGVE